LDEAATNPVGWTLLLGGAAAAANVLGGLVIVSRRHWNDLFLKYLLGLGAGFMLGATFLRMFPESMALTPHAPALMLAGYMLVHFFEHTLAPHFHFGEEMHEHLMSRAVGMSAVLGLSIHTFFDGVSIASGLMVSLRLGLLVFVAVLLHKIPEGVTVATIALASGQGKRVALTSSCILAAATFAGAVGMHFARGVLPYALPISTGVTLYVAASDLLPEVNEKRGMRMTAVVFLGLVLFAATDAILAALLGQPHLH
jgi:zinc transporter ZupT